ncbi:uncharacterized protein RB166_007226 [Leptodactylus fuscus]
MASAEDSKQFRIQTKHVLIAIIIIVSTLLLIGSVVLITIGYLNPFGTVGLGILGGGCVLYFSGLLFLCAGSIWVKNKYYADENDFKEKWPHQPSEDISLLKPASLNLTSTSTNESGCINDSERQSDNTMVPLYSVSTVYSSVSSVSTVPDRTTLLNLQRDDVEGTSECDVFSSSLTAMHHTNMKLQEKINLKQGSTEQTNCELSSECKIKDVEKRKVANTPILCSNGESVSDIPRQRKPVVIDFVRSSYPSNGEKQLVNHHNNGQSKEGNNTNSQICGRNKMSDFICAVEGPPVSAAQSKHHQYMAEQSKHMYERKPIDKMPKNYNQESKPVLEKRKLHTGEKDNQTSDRRWCVISEGDSWIHNPKVQVTTSKGLINVPASISKADKKHRSCENLQISSQEGTQVLEPYRPPNTGLDQSQKIQLMTSEHLNTKKKFLMKPEPGKGL